MYSEMLVMSKIKSRNIDTHHFTDHNDILTQQRLSKQRTAGVLIDLEAVKHLKTFECLGVMLDECLSFIEHIIGLKGKVSEVLGLVSCLCHCVTSELANHLYKSMVIGLL